MNCPYWVRNGSNCSEQFCHWISSSWVTVDSDLIEETGSCSKPWAPQSVCFCRCYCRVYNSHANQALPVESIKKGTSTSCCKCSKHKVTFKYNLTLNNFLPNFLFKKIIVNKLREWPKVSIWGILQRSPQGCVGAKAWDFLLELSIRKLTSAGLESRLWNHTGLVSQVLHTTSMTWTNYVCTWFIHSKPAT